MIYIIIALVFAILEIFTTGIFAIFIAFGFLVAGLVSFFTDNYFIIFVVGFLASCLSIACLRSYFVEKMHKQNKVINTGSDELIGKTTFLVEDTDDEFNSEIKINGVIWRVDTLGIKLKKGTKVRVVKLRGSHLKVEKVEE
ncbi:MAG: NfeD family protein [Mycoplasmatales bacterium]